MPIPTVIPSAGNATIITLTPTTTSVAVAAVNALRRGLTIYNNSSTNFLIGYTTKPVSTASFTDRILPNSRHELPLTSGGGVYQGPVAGAAETAPAAGGTVMVTETY